MEYNGGYMNAGYGAFTFQDSLSEDENEDIHHAVEYSILESNSAEINVMESSGTEEDEPEESEPEEDEPEEDEQYTGKTSMTTKRRGWRRLFSSLNVSHKIKQYDVTSWEPSISTSERDSSCHTNQVCDVCDEAIMQKKLSDRTHSYWGQTACSKHSSDGTARCCCCERFKIGNMGYISLNDGRQLCSECHCTAMLDNEAFISLYHEVYRFLEGIDMKIIEDIPVLLVDSQEIKRIWLEHGGKDVHLLGLTTYGPKFIVRNVVGSYQRGENINVVEEVRHIQPNKVTSMLIVYGYPRLAIGSTLAHEMMHAWMRTEGYNKLRAEVKEGICQVMAHKWVDWYAFVGHEFLHATPDQAQFLRNLKEFYKSGIETRYDETYGGGFRDAKWAIERFGLKYTMSHVKRTGEFPQ